MLVVMRRLTESEYLATMDCKPVPVGHDDAPPFDFWPYFESIPDGDFGRHDFSDGAVTYAWTMPVHAYQHVLIAGEVTNVFLVLVLDLQRGEVYGHHVLDLRQLYGLI